MFKINGRLSLSPFRGRSNEYQEFLGIYLFIYLTKLQNLTNNEFITNFFTKFLAAYMTLEWYGLKTIRNISRIDLQLFQLSCLY